MINICIRTNNELVNILNKFNELPITITFGDKEYVVNNISHEVTYTDPITMHLTMHAGNIVTGNIIK